MFGISFGELMVVAFITILVIKPRDLPRIAHFIGFKITQIKRFLSAIQQEWNNTKQP